MGVENIISYVNTKTDMVRCAYAYLYSLEGYHDFHRFIVEEKNKVYTIITTIDNIRCEIEITLKEVYKLAGKCNDQEELKEKIDKYIEKKLFKTFLSMVGKDDK